MPLSLPFVIVVGGKYALFAPVLAATVLVSAAHAPPLLPDARLWPTPAGHLRVVFATKHHARSFVKFALCT